MSSNPKQRVLLVVTGSIAAVKTLELIKFLTLHDIEVECVLTSSAKKFITPFSVAAYSGREPLDELFSLTDEVKMGHIALSRNNDLVVVAPASADFLAKMVHGLADDLASTLLLATNKPVLVAPAMNHKMWDNAATQRNVQQLRHDSVDFVGPVEGELACGEYGAGRMAEVEVIGQAILERLLQTGPQALTYDTQTLDYKPLLGKKAVVTSGPTVEAIDPVRFISNRSSGKQGYAIAEHLQKLGAEVTLVTGPTSIDIPAGMSVKKVQSAQEMHDAVMTSLPADIAVCTAAVADWRMKHCAEQKIKKEKGKDEYHLTFVENPDILRSVSQHATARPELVVGFAAESEKIDEHAKAKLAKKGCDWIVANDISDGQVFEKDQNTVTLYSDHGADAWATMSKQQVAHKLALQIAEFFEQPSQELKLAT